MVTVHLYIISHVKKKLQMFTTPTLHGSSFIKDPHTLEQYRGRMPDYETFIHDIMCTSCIFCLLMIPVQCALP